VVKPNTDVCDELPCVQGRFAIAPVLTSTKDPKAALDDAAAQDKTLIDKYNAAVK